MFDSEPVTGREWKAKGRRRNKPPTNNNERMKICCILSPGDWLIRHPTNRKTNKPVWKVGNKLAWP
jgi:hypothetical protein